MKTFVLVAFVASAAFGLAASTECTDEMQMIVNAVGAGCGAKCAKKVASYLRLQEVSNDEEVTHTTYVVLLT